MPETSAADGVGVVGDGDGGSITTKELGGVANFLAGGFGGICLVLVGHPLDLIKVKLQTGAGYNGVGDVALKTLRAEGPRGFYRGVSAPLLGITPIFATSFWGYDLGLTICKSLRSAGDNRPVTIWEKMAAGGFSALPSTVLTAPVERIKCLLQIQGEEVAKGMKPKYSGMVNCARQLYEAGGIGSVFKGWEATLMRDVPGSVVYFGTYELLKGCFTPEEGDISSAAILAAGGFAGMATWTVAIPPDVVKSRVQTAPEGTYTSIAQVFRTLMKEEGLGALYKGAAPAMLRAFPANAACFFGVEVAKATMKSVGFYW